MSAIARRWGHNIRRQRHLVKMSQVKLAEQLGVDQRTISRWEAGTSPPPDMQPRIAAALDVAPGDLFDYEQEVAS